MSRRPPSLLLALAVLLSACGSKDSEQPAELTDFQSTASVTRLWSASLSGNDPELRLGLGVAAAGEAVFAASHGGDVAAFNIADGRRLWQIDTKLKLTGGPGAGEGLVVVGASHGDVLALDAATGAERWRTRINSEILSAPYIGSGTVLLRAGDGRLVAMNAADGSTRWSSEEEVPRLSLRGTAQPVISGNLAVSGFDNGRVVALQLEGGESAWAINVAPPVGRGEIERLVDIDTALAASGNDIYVVTYQGKAARIDRDDGRLMWSRDVSSYSGLALGPQAVYISTAEGEVVKLDHRRDGIELWKQDALSRRRLSAPALLGNLVAVGDLDGYVHFLDQETGALAARTRVLGTRVSADPVIVGDVLVMMDADGKIAALRATPGG